MVRKRYSFHRAYFWLPINVLYTFEQLQWLYELFDTEYLNYITLTRCIPNAWNEKLNHEQMTYTQPTYPISLIDTEQTICKLNTNITK